MINKGPPLSFTLRCACAAPNGREMTRKLYARQGRENDTVACS
jgi:hypothetical protein